MDLEVGGEGDWRHRRAATMVRRWEAAAAVRVEDEKVGKVSRPFALCSLFFL
jgi:hypothetical protein